MALLFLGTFQTVIDNFEAEIHEGFVGLHFMPYILTLSIKSNIDGLVKSRFFTFYEVINID
jgi:hypothetical protein